MPQLHACVKLTYCIFFTQVFEELSQIKKILESGAHQQPPAPAHHMIKGRNVMLMPVRDGIEFALNLMDVIFAKEELSGHLCSVTNAGRKRTNKPLLPAEKVGMQCNIV